MHRLINAIGFQSAWWACVAGVGHGLEIPAIVFCAVLASVHLYIVEDPMNEIKLAALTVSIGIMIDSLLQYFSVVNFYGWSLGPLSPFGLWALWIMFSMTLNSSLSFLKDMPLVLSAAAGLLFGPLTYYAGAELGAATFEISAMHICAVALAWMLALPLTVYMATQISPHQSGHT
jgi:hypothetical protein